MSAPARVALLLAAALAGCAENAILELTVTAPDAATLGADGATRAVLDFVSADTEDVGALGRFPSRSLELALPEPGEELVHRASLVAGGDEVEAPLWIAIRYCPPETCDPSRETPRAYVRYERAFYVGEFTRHALALPPLGAPIVLVDRCEVFGCVGGGVHESCVGGVHYCEH